MKLLNPRIILPLLFFLFIAGIIYIADTAEYNFAFRWVGHIPYGDKIMHAVLYGIMALLLNYGLKFRTYKSLGFNMQLGAIIVLTFAVLEEVSQYWIPSRTCDVGDLIADLVGVVLFSLVKWNVK
jgi:VanZ family protein